MIKPKSGPVVPTDLTFIDNHQQSAITTLSPRQHDRLEADRRFPRSIKLGDGKNSRKVRILQEVLDWNRDRIAERDG